jgi:hypothetical protein
MVRNNMSDFSKTYTRSKKQKRVDEPEGISNPIEPSGTSSGPILRPRTSRASQLAVDEIVEEEEEEEEEEEGHETPSADNESEENYRMQFRHGKGLADDDDDDDDDEEVFGGRERGVEEEEEVLLEIHRPVNPSSHRIVRQLGEREGNGPMVSLRIWLVG